MALEVSFTEARDHLANYIVRAIEDNEVIKIHRKINGTVQTVALIAAGELESLMETAHLLRSPRNGERLYSAFERTENQAFEISSLEESRQEMDLERKGSERARNSSSDSPNEVIIREVR
jgi:antitoxin YefM